MARKFVKITASAVQKKSFPTPEELQSAIQRRVMPELRKEAQSFSDRLSNRIKLTAPQELGNNPVDFQVVPTATGYAVHTNADTKKVLDQIEYGNGEKSPKPIQRMLSKEEDGRVPGIFKSAVIQTMRDLKDQ